MGARVYDPYTGTFLQTDPIPGADANAYGYTSGDPVNETDLTGKSSGFVSPQAEGSAPNYIAKMCASGAIKCGGANLGELAEITADVGAGIACADTAGLGCGPAIAFATMVNSAVDAASGHPGDVAVDLAVGWFGESTIELGVKLMEEQGATKAVQIAHKALVGGITSFYEAEKLRKHE